ncbi:chymotrypsin inhibitor SCI-III-like [Drosophila serrata]|uniref:chymotrypsin inhibitor SCI-III-like n=1 Tax=Drosophila serrata TaxID=7274 RepID=UPI000A1CF7A2|nr:chymotrypsin inhibitor SCI-III-like [Drosophila serrata]
MMNMVLWFGFIILVGLVAGLKDPICEQEPGFVGDCRAAMRKYTYFVTNNTCERYIYGGCGGNENMFSTTKECEDSCVE